MKVVVALGEGGRRVLVGDARARRPSRCGHRMHHVVDFHICLRGGRTGGRFVDGAEGHRLPQLRHIGWGGAHVRQVERSYLRAGERHIVQWQLPRGAAGGELELVRMRPWREGVGCSVERHVAAARFRRRHVDRSAAVDYDLMDRRRGGVRVVHREDELRVRAAHFRGDRRTLSDAGPLVLAVRNGDDARIRQHRLNQFRNRSLAEVEEVHQVRRA